MSLTVVWSPKFVEGLAGGPRFVLDVAPPRGIAQRGAILCIQPFAEEANLCRRVLVTQAMRLALVGWNVTLPDLFGTGDSAGASHDVALEDWRTDLDRFGSRARAMSHSSPHARFVVWGVRLGAVLAADFLTRSAEPVDALLLWQPSLDGAALLGQAMRPRLRIAASKPSLPETAHHAMQQEQHRTSKPDEYVTITGYRYRRPLVQGLEALSVSPVAGAEERRPRVAIVHMKRGAIGSAALAGHNPQTTVQLPSDSPMPVAPPDIWQLVERWSNAGCDVQLRSVRAEPFWSSIEPCTPSEAFQATEAFVAQL